MNSTSTPQEVPASLKDAHRLGSGVGTYLLPLFLGYLLLVAFFRGRRERQMRRKFGYTTRASLKNMTNEDAFRIQNYIAELEFPTIFERSLEFALFKTYAFESMASLLVATRQLTSSANATRRYADTVILIKEFAAHPPTSERTLTAISRMNYLHGMYKKQGRISNDDFLYTLSVFVTEPINWVQKLEWRELNDMEKCAIGTFWKSIGDAMEIDYRDLPSAATGWRDALHWYEEVAAWARAYEVKYMLPNQPSRTTADYTMELLLWHVPGPLREAVFKASTVLMEGRLRKAMMYDDPSMTYIVVVNAVVTLRKWFLRYLCLPRPELLRVRDVADGPNPGTDRYNFRTWKAHPWYVSKRTRWGLEGWLTRLLPHGVLPGDDGDRYGPEGYRIEDIGPPGFVGKGVEAMRQEKDRLRKQRVSGCPFAIS